jgi:polyisoprenoid-binding protein YceI
MNKLVTAIACAGALGSAQAQTATYAIDPTHTFINFEVLHLGLSTSRGRLGKLAGNIEFDRGARRGKLDISIDVNNLDTGLPTLDKELRGKDFFNAERFPTARFVADRFVFNGDKVSEIEGSFTLLGVSLPLTLKASRFNCYPHPFLRREACGGDFEATLQRSKWGMAKYAPDVVADNVRLLIQVEAIRQ